MQSAYARILELMMPIGSVLSEVSYRHVSHLAYGDSP